MSKITIGFLKILTDEFYESIPLFSTAYREGMWATTTLTSGQKFTFLRITLNLGNTPYVDRFSKADVLAISLFLTSALTFSAKMMYIHRARIYQVSNSMIRVIRQIRIRQLKDYLGNIKQKKPIIIFRDIAVCLAFCSITGYSLYTFKALYDSQWLTLTFETLNPELMIRVLRIAREGMFYALIGSFPLLFLKPKGFGTFLLSSILFQSYIVRFPCAPDKYIFDDFCHPQLFNIQGGDICISRDMSQKPKIANSILEAWPKNEKNYDLISRLETYPLQKEFIIVPEWPIQEKIEMSSMDDLNLKGKINFPKNDEIITNVKQLNNSALNDLTGALEQLNQNFQAPIEQAPVEQSLPKKAKGNKYGTLGSRMGTLENIRKEEEFYQEIEIQNKYQHTDIASRYRQKRLSILENNKKNN